MDPNACVQMMLGAIATGRMGEAAEHAANLRDWIARGGFAPDPIDACDVAQAVLAGEDDGEDDSEDDENGEIAAPDWIQDELATTCAPPRGRP